LYKGAYPAGWRLNFDRYSWTGSPGMRCGMAHVIVAPTKNVSTYVTTFRIRYRRTGGSLWATPGR
jgi:hypothetical protein